MRSSRTGVQLHTKQKWLKTLTTIYSQVVKTERVEAVYEGGILRPLKKVHLKEGEKVEIIIKRSLYDIISELEKGLREVDEDLTAQLVRDRK